mgnify:FL=1
MSKKVGRHREEYEQFKSELREYHLDKYTSWLENLQEEGYDVTKWEPDEIIDTYIKENNLWNSVEIIKEAIAKGKKKKDDTYLETDMEKRRKNNEKAIADMKKVKDDTVPRWMREDVRQRLEEARRGPRKEGKEKTEDKAKASLEAVKKRQKVLDKHEEKTGKKLDIKKSVEGRAHAKDFPGSRQEKKNRGEKETDLQTHNRRVNKYSERLRKYGKTTKQKRDDDAMAKHTSRFD